MCLLVPERPAHSFRQWSDRPFCVSLYVPLVRKAWKPDRAIALRHQSGLPRTTYRLLCILGTTVLLMLQFFQPRSGFIFQGSIRWPWSRPLQSITFPAHFLCTFHPSTQYLLSIYLVPGSVGIQWQRSSTSPCAWQSYISHGGRDKLWTLNNPCHTETNSELYRDC